MKLLIEPDHGVAPLLAAIKKAKTSIEITIFRMDRRDIEDALEAAARRGVKVTALVAYANRGGQKQLRNLEMRLLQSGIIVARTGDDLVRYHDKFMIVDRKTLFVLSFNFTHLDIVHSRAFGISTRNAALVTEATRLFEADCTRSNYSAGLGTFIVSPANSRKELGKFIRRAQKELLIYDPEISDKEMIRLLKERAKAGVEIRVVGYVNKSGDLRSTELNELRLHTRTIVRDRHQAFIGSQSLRGMELDKRREVGLILRDARIVKALIDTFESDWAKSGLMEGEQKATAPPTEPRTADKVAEALVKELHPVRLTVKKAVKKVVARAGDGALKDEEVKRAVKKIVKKAVKEAVKEVTQGAVA